jgi:hypothetical protein
VGIPTKDSKLLVIDTNVMRASGMPDAINDRAKMSRDILSTVREICHRIVLTDKIKDEWRKHGSRFFRQWLVSMYAKRKVVRVQDPSEKWWCDQLEKCTTKTPVLEAMKKDLCLVITALESDNIIISFDETARKQFIDAAKKIRKLKEIVWINPEIFQETIDWLEQGCQPLKKLSLGNGNMCAIEI